MLLVTGITGHSGGYFLQELIKNKYEGPIRCVVRQTSDTNELDKSGLSIEKAVGDLHDQAFLDKSLAGVKTVLHIAGIGETPFVIDAAIKNNVERAILVHTTGIYSKYKSASELYKKIEKEVDEKIPNQPDPKIQITILRPTMIYGDIRDHNISKFIKMVDRLRIFPVINRGTGLIQPVNARDLGRAYYQVLMNNNTGGKSYVLSGNNVVTMLEMFKRISSTLGKQTYFLSVPVALGVFMARILKLGTMNRIDFVEKVQRMAEDRCYPNDSARKDFDYNPMEFFDGLDREVIEYMGSL